MDAFVHPIEEQRLGGFNASPLPNFRAHFEPPSLSNHPNI